MTYYSFSVKKFLNNPKNKICLAILVLLLFGLFMANKTAFKQKFYQSTLDATTINIQQTEQMGLNVKNELKLNPDDEILKASIKELENEKKLFQSQLEALKVNDLEKYANLGNQVNLLQIKRIPSDTSEEYLAVSSSIKYYRTVKAVNGKMGVSMNDTSESAFTIAYAIVSWLSSTVIFVLLTVLIADNLSSEIETSQIRFYQIIGGRNFKQLIVNLLSPIFVVTLITVISFTVLYLIGGVQDSFGTWRYPYYTPAGDIVPIYQLVIKTLILFIVSLLFIASLGQILSLIFKKSLVVIGIIVLFLTGFLTFEKEVWFQPLKMFFPFEYLGYGRLLNDAEFLPSNAFGIGLIYLLSLSFIFIMCSSYLYKNYYYRKVGKNDRT